MNKKLIIAVVVILLLLGGYFFMKKGGSSSTNNNSSVTSDSNKPSSLKDLISKGVAQTCTYSNENGKGTFYVSGGKTRGDFETTAGGVTTKGHMLVDSGTSYVWMDGQKTGFKSTFDTSTSAQPSSNPSTAQTFDVDASINYDCKPGVVDSSIFTAPKDVEFMSFDSLTKPTSGSGTGGSSACSYCSNLTGDDKAQCLTALKCN